jgi:hypothetical protein
MSEVYRKVAKKEYGCNREFSFGDTVNEVLSFGPAVEKFKEAGYGYSHE